VVDRLDACPDVPGPAEAQGCPKSGAVKLVGQRIEFEGTVYFDTDKDVIQSRSFELLDGIATVINAHPELGRIRVEGHTDSQGGREHNLDLSKRRAKAVVRYLAAKGVDEGRLTSEGFGPDRPVDDNKTREGRAKNRRVEFHVEQPPAAGEKP
jgi:outer membrane protein OmpA-like peptidoglycan-associated protein